ncbi:unnamed protein product [Oppiella nova]|uniref:Uncharacterized protein n=1 Tax=Oppiella nova TaxID=334625 RepID=A0A7R9M5F1_9ACAR|nr:unnamed protein product [Oppiella nova]CAG2170580.1 unnamed protein product [Oppiella nova]
MNLCTAMSAPAIPKCVQRFTQELKDSRNQVLKSYETRGYCCAFNDLKDCIVEHVGDKCGHTKTIRQLVAPFVETLKDISTPSGDCDDFDGFRGTVLCQPDWLLIVEAIGVVILLLMSVSAVIRCCCCGSRGGVRPYPMQSFVNPIAAIIITTPAVVTGLDLLDVITPLCAAMSMNGIFNYLVTTKILTTLTMRCAPLIVAMITATPLMVYGSDVSAPVAYAECVDRFRMCAQAFTQELTDSKSQVPEPNDTRGYCCALTRLRDCVVEHVGDKCGVNYMNGLVVGARPAKSMFYTAFKDISTPSDVCHDFRGFRRAVSCQPDWLLIVEAIVVVILFLMSVSPVIWCCYRRLRGGDPPYRMLFNIFAH